MTDESTESESARVAEVYGRRGDQARYSPFCPAHLRALHEVESGCLALLRQSGHEDLSLAKVLDVGCGVGYWLRRMIDWGVAPNAICGVDILPGRLEAAAAALPRTTDLRKLDAARLPWADGTFDLVTQFVVFSSILDVGQRRAVAGEMSRVLKPGGVLLSYDFCVDNPRNPDVARVRRSDLEGLFPGYAATVRSVTLAPPIARALARRAPWAIRFAAAIPALRTHLLAVLVRNDGIAERLSR